MGGDKDAQILSIGAAIGVVALALTRRAEAAPSGTLQLDEETMQLLMAMANQLTELDKIDDIITAINNISVNGGQGYPPNTDGFRSFVVPFPLANQAIQLPEFIIPDDFTLILKAAPANAGIILIGPNAADSINVNQAYPLLPNEFIGLRIHNSKAIYASATFGGDNLHCIVEMRSVG